MRSKRRPTSRPGDNLQKRSNNYYFRIRVPTNIRHRFCTSELKFSLKTDSQQEAKRRSVVITGKVSELFQILESSRSGLMTKLPSDKLRKIVRDYVTNGWDFDPVVKDPHDIDRQYELTEDRLAELKEELALNWDNRNRIVGRPDASGKLVRKPWIEWLVEDHNLKGLDEDSKALFAREMVRAEIELLKIRLEKLKGNYDARQLADALAALGVQSVDPLAALSVQPEQTSISLANLIEDFWEDRVSTWKTRTVVEYKKVREHILEHIEPETQVHTLNHDRMKEYRQVLQDHGLSVSRINLYIGFINSVFRKRLINPIFTS